MRSLLKEAGLHTVCQAARCPNIGTCWEHGTATFMILGRHCTRHCRFCAVPHGRPAAPDADEPHRIATAVRQLGLRYIVITSVTRDDLSDGGAGHFARTIRAIREMDPALGIEVLIPDFQLNPVALHKVVEARPDVIAHNIETVAALYPQIRPQADYRRSLQVLQGIHQLDDSILVKSGFMVGLGETDEQIRILMEDLRARGVAMLTIGQYLAPSQMKRHVPVQRFVAPEQFDVYKQTALDMGFTFVMSGPLVRSSFFAEAGYRSCLSQMDPVRP